MVFGCPKQESIGYWSIKVINPPLGLKKTFTNLALVKRVSTGSSEELVEQGAAHRRAAGLLLITLGNGRGVATPGNGIVVAAPPKPIQAGL